MSRKKRSGGGAPVGVMDSGLDADPIAYNGQKAYELRQAPMDFLRWRHMTEWFFINKLIEIDHWYEERTPKDRGDDDWVSVLDDNDENTVYQVLSSMIRPTTRKTMAMLDGKRVVVSFDPVRNPEATPSDLAYAGVALTDIYRQNDMRQLGNQLSELVRLIMLRGTYFTQYELVDAMPKGSYGGKSPIRVTTHDVFDCAWDVAPDLGVKRVIIRRTVTWGQLPQEYKDAVHLEREPTYDRNVRIYEVWTESHHGILINGTEAKAMTPHGYPCCPFTVAMHQPTPMRFNQAPPRAGQWEPWAATWIGRPVCEDLLASSEVDSRLMTAMMENTKRMSITPMVGKGLMLREDENVIDAINGGLIALEDTVTSDVHYLTTPDGVSNGLRLKQEYDKRNTDVAGADPSQWSGQVKDRTSVSSVSEQESWTRAAAEAIRTTISEERARGALMMASILVPRYKPSTHRRLSKKHPELVAQLGSAIDLDKDDGHCYPDYCRLTGSEEEVIDGQTFSCLSEADIKIPATQLFSIEQGHNIALQMNNLPAGKQLLSRRSLMDRYLQVENVEAELAQVMTDELMADPTLPVGKLLRVRAWVETRASEIGDAEVHRMQTMIDKVIPQAIEQSIQSIVQQYMPAPDLPKGAAGAPMPGGPPVPGMPAGGPMQQPPPGGLAPPPPGGPPPGMGGPPPAGPPQGMLPQGFPSLPQPGGAS